MSTAGAKAAADGSVPAPGVLFPRQVVGALGWFGRHALAWKAGAVHTADYQGSRIRRVDAAAGGADRAVPILFRPATRHGDA
jgi:hypothetical protein